MVPVIVLRCVCSFVCVCVCVCVCKKHKAKVRDAWPQTKFTGEIFERLFDSWNLTRK